MSKVTMQDIAQAAGVSRITVWKALSNRSGVSEKVRRRVQLKASDMGYLSNEPAAVAHQPERTFAVVVSRPESSSFWMQIIHHFAKELTLHNISLMYTYMPTTYKKGYVLPSSLSAESIDGFLVLNLYDEVLLGMLTKQALPKVFLDTVPTIAPDALNGDLIILEGYHRVRQITSRMLESGFAKIGFIGDVNYAQTNFDRYQGFLDAHAARGIEPDATFLMTGAIGLGSHYEEISQFLSGLQTLPDGIVCASDFIAHFVKRYLAESGRVQDAELILTGFDNNPEYANVAEHITTVDVQTAMLGKSLASKLIFRTDNPAAPHEVTYVATQILYRGGLKK